VNPTYLRSIVALTVMAAFEACSIENAIVPIAQRQNTVANATAMVHGLSSPCDIRKAWYFRGSCTTLAMKSKGITVTLGVYHGLALTEHIPANNAKSHDTFVFGEGTSDADITGMFEGSIFPVYGSVRCVNIDFQSVPCAGKALLYHVMQNTSTLAIGWNSTPKFHITDAKAFPGTTCKEATLNLVNEKWVWELLPIRAKPKNGAVTFQPWTAAVALVPSQFGVFGFICS